ncbi:MAG: hypothetical protein ABIO70_17345 [Pseudomonadota bacterium]
MNPVEQITSWLQRKNVADMKELREVLGGRSRRSVFRDLSEAGYRTSYTHVGRYYTLEDIPAFDDQGLWFYRDIGFSRAGTLKQTTAVQVEQTPEGRTHDELRGLLRVRVHNTLLGLVREGRVGRERVGRVYLYVNADPDRAAQQVAERRELGALMAEMLRVPTDEEVVEVLAEALRAAPAIPTPEHVARCLVARGVRLEPHHVQMVYEEHGLVPGKKTVRPSSPRSRR